MSDLDVRTVTRPKAFAVPALAYSAAACCAAAGVDATWSGGIDAERVGLIAIVMGIAALIPFLMAKFAMKYFEFDGVVAHAVSGLLVGVYASSLLHREPDLVIRFGLWGLLAGLVYWVVRAVGRQVLMGSAE